MNSHDDKVKTKWRMNVQIRKSRLHNWTQNRSRQNWSRNIEKWTFNVEKYIEKVKNIARWNNGWDHVRNKGKCVCVCAWALPVVYPGFVAGGRGIHENVLSVGMGVILRHFEDPDEGPHFSRSRPSKMTVETIDIIFGLENSCNLKRWGVNPPKPP